MHIGVTNDSQSEAYFIPVYPVFNFSSVPRRYRTVDPRNREASAR